MVNLLEQEGLDCCDLMERCYASRTGEKKFPRRVLMWVIYLWLLPQSLQWKKEHYIVWSISQFMLLKNILGKGGILEVRQKKTSPGCNPIPWLPYPVRFEERSNNKSFIKMGDFVSPWAILSVYLKKGWLEAGQPWQAAAYSCYCKC